MTKQLPRTTCWQHVIARAASRCRMAKSRLGGWERRHDRVVADARFDDPRLARVYDALDPDRSDLDVYMALVDELGVRSVLDIGCGTGTFACMLAGRGIEVTAVDPAAAILDVARAKPGANAVRWVHGDATMLPALHVDAAFMTANVAQVFLADDDWAATLTAARQALRSGGWLVFETRVPARRAWERWTRRAHPYCRRRARHRDRGVLGGRHRRGRRPRHVPVDDHVLARQCPDRVGVDVAVPRSARDRGVVGRQRLPARRDPRRSRSPRPRVRLPLSRSRSPCGRSTFGLHLHVGSRTAILRQW